jgi:hypothetical protein
MNFVGIQRYYLPELPLLVVRSIPHCFLLDVLRMLILELLCFPDQQEIPPSHLHCQSAQLFVVLLQLTQLGLFLALLLDDLQSLRLLCYSLVLVVHVVKVLDEVTCVFPLQNRK